jgi:AAA+ ATPase superfamily predicted ATPase
MFNTDKYYVVRYYLSMDFVNRVDELGQLDRVVTRGGLAVVYGRRRLGKTRLLVEWSQRHAGVYTVAEQSSPEIQRRYLADAIAQRLPGFADVDYRDWRSFFARLAADAKAAGWRGPIVFDELPYLVEKSPELPSVLQRWIDHEARSAKLAVAIAGSSQRMMQGLVLAREAPLFGRATALFEVRPLDAAHLTAAIGTRTPRDIVDAYTAWGGVPRYWELAADFADTQAAVEGLVLDPAGVLHLDRLLLEEQPSAAELRPLLDAIGAGAHRFSEIAARIGRPVTALSRPLERLVELGIVTREIPFGEPARTSKKSLYKLADPFMRLWFRVVAPHRAELVAGTRASRAAVLARHWEHLAGQAWEELCRSHVPRLAHPDLGPAGSWKPAARWWNGDAEWDVVAEDVKGKRLLVGECRLASSAGDAVRSAASRAAPVLSGAYRQHEVVRVAFVPHVARRAMGSVIVVTASDLLRE